MTVGSIVAATALLATACSGSGSSSGSSAEPKVLNVWHYLSTPGEVKYIDAYAKMFEASHPGVTVKNVYVPYDQIVSKVVAAAGTKNGPDVVEFNGPDTGTLAAAGALAKLDTQWAGFADKDQFPKSVIHTYQGSTYSVQGLVNLLGLWYNKDLLDSLGLTPPTTIDELESDMAKAKTAGKMGITLSGLPNPQGEFQAYPWVTDAGFSYGKPNADSLKKAYTTVRGWVSQGYLSPEVVTWDQTVPFQTWEAGKTLFAENGNWQIGTAKTDAKFTYGVVPLPVGSTGKVYLGGETVAIGAFAKAPKLAWEYMQGTFLSKEGELAELADAGGLPARLDLANDPAVTGDPLLTVFAGIIAKQGANYPDNDIPPKNVSDVQLAGGQGWSSALGGTASPGDAAAKVVQVVKPLVAK